MPQACLLFLATACMAMANTPTTIDASKNEPKTHTLYMGADFRIAYGQELYRVCNVAGDSFVILVNGKEVLVPMKAGALKLKIDQSLKLTEASAAIEKLQNERSYTIDNTPRHRWLANRAVAPGQISVGDTIDKAQDPFLTKSPTKMSPAGATVENLDYYSALSAQDAAIAHSLSGIDAPGRNLNSLDEEIARGLFDAVEVKFDVSAEKPLMAPYVVLVAQYHAKDKPQSSQNWIYAQALKPIQSQPAHVHILQGGFPLGFELEKCSVHLYDGGTEIATNVADNRVQLTREEAFLYIVMDYLGRHKGATLPASPAMTKIPEDWPTRTETNKTCYVKVAKTGHPQGAYEDKACSKKLSDRYIASVVMDARFLPAMAEGKAVDSVAKLSVGDLAKFAR